MCLDLEGGAKWEAAGVMMSASRGGDKETDGH